MSRRRVAFVTLAGGLLAAWLSPAAAQPMTSPAASRTPDATHAPRLDPMHTPRLTSHDSTLHLVVSVADRELTVVVNAETVARMPIGVATGETFTFAGRVWRFQTPEGRRRVVRKVDDPVWIPPDWHYAEAARANGLRLVR